MRIAVLSGKGGTGKTLLSVNLAAAANQAVYIDCDVEEPNGHLFFKPQITCKEVVAVPIPVVNPDLCVGCRQCVDFCKFGALAYIKDQLLIFDTICHSCGGCVLLCPQKALAEIPKSLGTIQKGSSGNVEVYTGALKTGEASGVPIIRELLSHDQALSGVTIIDCPPGSSCGVMESIKDADYCILVAEPTVFGVANLEMVYELVRLFGKPFGVVLNKCLEEQNLAQAFCLQRNIRILGQFPFDRVLGRLNSDAKIAVRESEVYQKVFCDLLDTVVKEVQYATAPHP